MLRNLRLSKPYFELKASEIASMPSPNFSGSDEVFTELQLTFRFQVSDRLRYRISSLLLSKVP